MDSVQRYRDRRLSRMKENWSRYDSVEEYQARKWLRYWNLDDRFSPQNVDRWITSNGRRIPIINGKWFGGSTEKAKEKIMEHETGDNARGKPASVPEIKERGKKRKEAEQKIKRDEKTRALSKLKRLKDDGHISEFAYNKIRQMEDEYPMKTHKQRQDVHIYGTEAQKLNEARVKAGIEPAKSYFTISEEEVEKIWKEHRWEGGNVEVFLADGTWQASWRYDTKKNIGMMLSANGKVKKKTTKVKFWFGVDGVHGTPKQTFD